MAWHSGKPADNDLQSASVRHIRENFAELEPLQPHIAELVDLTALQPHVAELVDLTALHPHIAALLDSRIVEMGSNSNGTYVRWENGLQVCFGHEVGEGPSPVDWVLPAAFVDERYAVVGTSVDWPFTVVTVDWRYTSKSNVRFRKWEFDGTEFTGVLRAINSIAIGKWK